MISSGFALRFRRPLTWGIACAALTASALMLTSANAQDSWIEKLFAKSDAKVTQTIKTNLAKNIPNLPAIEAVNATPIDGIYEVQLANKELVYSSADGQYILQGEMIDTAKRMNLTAQRLDKINAIDFAKLPLQDAIVVTRGDGKRKMAVFADPNCGYCKRFEQELLKVDNVTVYTFLYPILGPDSIQKSQDIWCAKDKGKVWIDWMTKSQPIADAKCDNTTALQRNVDFGRTHRISGTPAVLFENGKRIPGAMDKATIEQHLAAASK